MIGDDKIFRVAKSSRVGICKVVSNTTFEESELSEKIDVHIYKYQGAKSVGDRVKPLF